MAQTPMAPLPCLTKSFLDLLSSVYIETNLGWPELPFAGTNFHYPKPF